MVEFGPGHVYLGQDVPERDHATITLQRRGGGGRKVTLCGGRRCCRAWMPRAHLQSSRQVSMTRAQG